MITSKQITGISEKYLTLANSYGHPVEIFENPTSSDYKELLGKINPYHQVRFTADMDSKKVYVWDALGLMHGEAAHHIGIYSKYGQSNKAGTSEDPLFMGLATISGNKAVVVGGSDWMELIISVVASDTGHKMKKERAYLARLTGGAWSWVNTYLDCTKFFNKIKDVLK